ncbi:Proproteinase E [Liparis tanakae]|uniref:Proproteinase E n=1 Tax=Liparis tanakae TaxID=230148 RepID=A0A4Z2GNF1_9TELE|nr:Proproteinase E [Liparis tanakae]
MEVALVLLVAVAAGPLNCEGGDGKWYVEGVTSFVDGRACNTTMKPTVFTRVASFVPWIRETMARN